VRQRNREQKNRIFQRLNIVLDFSVEGEHIIFMQLTHFGRKPKTNCSTQAIYGNPTLKHA